jgi:hypothetical protein
MLLGIGISLLIAATLSFAISFLVLNMAKRGWLVLDEKEMNALLIPFINLLGVIIIGIRQITKIK